MLHLRSTLLGDISPSIPSTPVQATTWYTLSNVVPATRFTSERQEDAWEIDSEIRSTRQSNTDLPVGRHFASPGHASTNILVFVIHSGFRDTPWFSNTKHHIRADLIPTLPSYKLPKSVHFECVHERTLFLVSARPARASNFKFRILVLTWTLYHVHSLQLLFIHWWRGSSLETYGNLNTFSPSNEYFLSFLITLNDGVLIFALVRGVITSWFAENCSGRRRSIKLNISNLIQSHWQIRSGSDSLACSDWSVLTPEKWWFYSGNRMLSQGQGQGQGQIRFMMLRWRE